MKFKNKKAQIGTTLTWFVAFVIIFFVALGFLAITGVLAANKNIPIIGEKNEVSISSSVFRESQNVRRLESLMNKEVEFKNEKLTVEESILKVVDPYTKESFLSKKDIKDVNQIYLYLSMIPKGTFVAEGINIEEQKDLYTVIKNNFDRECFDYYLKTPFGYVFSIDKKSENYFSPKIPQDSERALGKQIYEIPYNNQIIKLEFGSRIKC